MLSINVCTVNGKTQEFVFNTLRSIGEIKSQVIKNHCHLTLSGEQDIRLLYKGIELDEMKTLDNYGITARASIQIIHKTKPISISRRNSDANSSSVFETYAPSPLMTMYTSNTKSPSPNFNQLAVSNDTITQHLSMLNTKLDNMINHMGKLEQRINQIYESVVPLNK